MLSTTIRDFSNVHSSLNQFDTESQEQPLETLMTDRESSHLKPNLNFKMPQIDSAHLRVESIEAVVVNEGT